MNKTTLSCPALSRLVDFFVKSFLAGIVVCVAGVVYINNKDISGIIFFSVGLLVILRLGFKLFTGIVGFESNWKNLAISLFGNFVGIFFGSLIFKNKIKDLDFLSTVVQNKINSDMLLVFFSAIVCGILIYTAALSYKMNHDDALSVILCVSMFVIFGADHCIANSFFYCVSGKFSLSAFVNILICVLGNSLGAIMCSVASPLMLNRKIFRV
ncbi:MAG: formate/nitrite transporter family protein [Oscillospiraceae bacterium]|nr:formate/nitrite transporter family protein [Oscillospiraceae bacterium]